MELNEMESIAAFEQYDQASSTWSFTDNFTTEDYQFLESSTSQQFEDPDSGSESWDSVTFIWVQIAWTAVFSVMIVTATVGNCIVIWIVIAHRRMRTVTNYFLVNLSIADLMLITLNCTFNFTYMIQRHWPFGSWYCTVSNFIANVTVAASVFTLTAISCDRYLAIVYPLHPRMSKVSSLVAITFIWATSMVFALPCLLYSTIITNGYKGENRTGCIMIWPDQKLVGSQYDLWYQMFFLIVTYLVPMTLMSLCYTIMGKVLWGSKSIGERTQRQINSIRSKRKVVKMFFLVVMIFGLCWLPYHAYFIYVYFDTEVIFGKYTQHVYLSFYWFAMSNAMVNPLIYYWMNTRFRQYFQTAVYCSKLRRILGGKKRKLNVSRVESHNSYSKSRDGSSVRVRNNKRQDNINHNLSEVNAVRELDPRSSTKITKTSIKRDTQKITTNV
ncbi:tachykinin-like peptides receptor 86C [Cylas formicarius]|uniref:tachykinin-like peptides receptor 86C n=1 Tax=Cylas formicarius TaxID=197179 RepID=UPI002958C15E|nr:tachykinin-like peptides receptor 86C [Cylas formicarius]